MSLDQEPPVHVKVAIALACKPVFEATSLHTRADQSIWRCLCPAPLPTLAGVTIHDLPLLGPPRHVELMSGTLAVARYDLSWFATGPWIERFEIAVTPAELGPAEAAEIEVPGATRRVWVATHPGREVCYSTMPLRAVCAWIIANVKDGKVIGG